MRARRAGRAVPRALAGAGRRGPGRAEGRRRLCSARSRATRVERLAFVLGDCEARVLVTQERLLERLTGRAAGGGVPGPRCGTGCAARARATRRRAAAPENLAYVIYTSGSTGQPKGVPGRAPQRGTAVRGHPRVVWTRPRTTSGRCCTPTRSTSRCGRCGARCCTAARLSSSPAGRPARPRRLRSCWCRSASPF